jgi:hypothetical protein
MDQRHTPATLYPRKRPGTHGTGGWVGPGPVWTGAENVPPPGFDPRQTQVKRPISALATISLLRVKGVVASDYSAG